MYQFEGISTNRKVHVAHVCTETHVHIISSPLYIVYNIRATYFNIAIYTLFQ